MLWFVAILAPGSGFQVTSNQKDGYSHYIPRALSLAANKPPFNIETREGRKDLNMSGHTPLAPYEALQSLIDLCNRHGVSSHQLHAALATALLFPTHNYLSVDVALPCSTTTNSRLSTAKLRSEDLNQLYNDIPYYITLSCGGDSINSTLCGVFWNPHVSHNLVSPWLQPLMDSKGIQGIEGVSERYAEILAMIYIDVFQMLQPYQLAL